jgi:LuxR family maltose regulon positive regulatory protein
MNMLDGLLATKLYAPPPPSGFVPRPRLTRQLEDGLRGTLTLLCAPAGFGKTALLSDLCMRHPEFVWLALDVGDNDPARLWRHVVAALAGARAGIVERVGPLLGPPPPTTFEGLVTAVVNELSAEPDGIVLILDDYHVIDTEQVHASIRFLLEHRPAGLHVVMASRTEPPLPLARLRVRDQLTELRGPELRFTVDETAALLRDALGLGVHDDAVATLASRTEGWAAGLQLAGLSLRHHPDAAGFVATFSGSHRYVLDYLTEEVLDRQSDAMRRFLLETSVLERLCAPLCDAVTGRDDSQRALEAIERANLFLVPLDETRGWWRYHHLFADLLRTKVGGLEPERARELHRRAAAWHEQQGLCDDAVRHAMSAGEYVVAARLIERHFDALYLSSEGATACRWIAALPSELVAARPRLNLVQAALNLIGGRVDVVGGLLDAAERADDEAKHEPFEPSVGKGASRFANIPAGIAVGRSYIAHMSGDGESSMALAAQALVALDDGDWMLAGLARTSRATGAWVRGWVESAEEGMSSAVDGWLEKGHYDLATFASSGLGRIRSARGRLDAALRTYRRVQQAITTPGMPLPPAAGVALVDAADIAYQRDGLVTAAEEVTEGLALCRDFPFVEFVSRGLSTLAWIRQAMSDPAGALEAMDEAYELCDPTVCDVLNPVPARGGGGGGGRVAAGVRPPGARGPPWPGCPAVPRWCSSPCTCR